MRVRQPVQPGSRDGKLFVVSDANTLEVRGITVFVLKHAHSLLFSMVSETGKFDPADCRFCHDFCPACLYQLTTAHRISRDAEACI